MRTLPQPAKAVIIGQGRKIYAVAADVHLNPNTFGAVLNRRLPPPDGLPERLADVLGVPAIELFDDIEAA